YNPTVPFMISDKCMIVGRVENRDSEESQAIFFEEIKENEFALSNGIKDFKLQDPFISCIYGEWVLGGTEIFKRQSDPGELWWRTAFYYGEDINNLKLLVHGPNGMKDIRIVELNDKRIGVFTRPQGVVGGRGKIGFMIIESLDDLSSKRIEDATILEQFLDEEWGGVNQAVCLDNGHIGVIGHIAKYSDDGARHYYSMAFILNPLDLSHTPMKIIAVREDFLDGESKRTDLKDVLFSAGIVIKNNKTFLYTGVGDVEVQMAEIVYPF
ncbi:MAG: DUF1861 family protein, partial [Clostridiales bacterium]|nr:DUF1861 family protein [Clostridiales bacterium]